MCGIVGYIGNNYAQEIIINGLEKLEYRGYDSSGIALKEEKITIIKDQGKVKHLKTLLTHSTSKLGIGHTRWATHGKPNKTNAHPHSSYNSHFVIVHNGIIDNYLELKQKYLNNIDFYSQTDTEVIANLLMYLSQKHSLLDSLAELKTYLKGSYALLILNSNDNNLYFIKNQTPLVIGTNENEKMISSDALSFPASINKQIILDDGDYGYVSKNSIHLFNNGAKEYTLIDVKQEKSFTNKSYAFHMEKEIDDQMFVIDEIINKYFSNKKINISPSIRRNILNADKIIFIACGSSYYSSEIGKYYFNHFLKKEVDVILASEALYDFPKYTDKTYFIFVSQSGETLDVINMIKECKKRNIKFLGITNANYSTLTYLCDEYLLLYAGREISVASTKAFLCQCLVFLILTQKENCYDNLILLKNSIKKILEKKELVNKISLQIKDYKDVFFLGRNIDYFIAQEGALKLKEISYIHAESFPCGELKHGPLALIDKNTACIFFITQENTNLINRSNIQEIVSRDSNIIIVSKKTLSNKDDDFILDDLPNYIMPLSSLIFVQLLAFFTAKNKNLDIDMPRNLAKSVTVE